MHGVYDGVPVRGEVRQAIRVHPRADRAKLFAAAVGTYFAGDDPVAVPKYWAAAGDGEILVAVSEIRIAVAGALAGRFADSSGAASRDGIALARSHAAGCVHAHAGTSSGPGPTAAPDWSVARLCAERVFQRRERSYCARVGSRRLRSNYAAGAGLLRLAD